MKDFMLVLSCPHGNIFENKARSLILRGERGDLAVMPGHIPFVTTVKPGKFKILTSEGEEINGVSSGGLLSASNDRVVFLAGEME